MLWNLDARLSLSLLLSIWSDSVFFFLIAKINLFVDLWTFTEKDRERERERHTHTHRETDRQTERQRKNLMKC